MCYNQHGFSHLLKMLQSHGYFLHMAQIQAAGRFIKNQELTVRYHGGGNRHTLFLSTRERHRVPRLKLEQI